MKIEGTKVLLTGATGGIGHAIARRLHDEGASLVLTGRRTAVLEPLAAELGATAIGLDLADLDAVAGLARSVADVDILVANAALPASGHLLSFSPLELHRALTVNLEANILLARLLGEQMVARGRGQLVFISSLAGKSSAGGSSVYSATKFGLRGFAQGLREDLRTSGVGVSTIFPGFISDAGMFADTGAELPRGVGTRTPQQVAAAVVCAITKNRGEVDVAPLSLALGAKLANAMPEIAARFSRIAGADKISADIAAGQTHRR